MADGNVVMAPYTNMPEDVKAMAEETEAKITSGELRALHRPDQEAGRLRWLADGEAAETARCSA
jgi:basic membrane protein A